MKDLRTGETLWLEWTGDTPPDLSRSNLVFYTEDHVDLDTDVVKRALASALQRDGSAVTLAEGFRMVESSVIVHTWGGEVDGETTYTVCGKDGETYEGDYVDRTVKLTLVAL